MLQVGLRSENIMITHPESSAYRPTLSHSSTTTPDQWPRSASSSTASSAVPAPREPATSARGAPSVFRHHSTGSHATAHGPTPTPSNPPLFEQSAITTNSLPPSGSLGTSSATTTTASSSSSSSSTTAAPDSQTLSPTRAKRASEDTPPVLLRNLDHVVELAKDDCLHAQAPPRRNRSGYEDKRRYEISSMPVGDVIEMVAGLLTKITTTNDRQHEHLHRNIPPPDAAASMSTTTNSVLAFHGKNVPSITIMSYLSRIHKYCPTTYEVFLSLLVYFDRMTERVNKKNMQPGSGAVGTVTTGENGPETPPTAAAPAVDPYNPSHVFVVDSYNIHRLVIAGVTCASKFFSDVFYTNSRYAKVGGLPLAELNHLELQFLILNDFRLSVPVEELEAYGTMLVQFYAREAIANVNLQSPLTAITTATSSNSSSSTQPPPLQSPPPQGEMA